MDDTKPNVDYYRPVSILPAFSNIFQRSVLKQLIHYMDEQSLLLPSTGISGLSVFLGIRDDLIRAMTRGEVSSTVLADYSKAFDSVIFTYVGPDLEDALDGIF